MRYAVQPTLRMRHLADRQADRWTSKQAERQTRQQDKHMADNDDANGKNGVAAKMTKITIAFCVLSYVTQRNSYDFIIILLRVFLRPSNSKNNNNNEKLLILRLSVCLSISLSLSFFNILSLSLFVYLLVCV